MTDPIKCSKCTYEAVDTADLNTHIIGVHTSRADGGSRAAPPAREKPSKRQKISEVGEHTDAGLACPKCGGTQFKVKRSGLRKVTAVAAAPITVGLSAAVMAPKGTQVRCVTCGTVYKRG